jgi:hypothetical protein
LKIGKIGIGLKLVFRDVRSQGRLIRNLKVGRRQDACCLADLAANGNGRSAEDEVDQSDELKSLSAR